MKNLNNIFIYLDDSNPYQRHFDLVIAFYDEETKDYYNYSLEFDEGMPIKDFKEYMTLLAKTMGKLEPMLCREDEVA